VPKKTVKYIYIIIKVHISTLSILIQFSSIFFNQVNQNADALKKNFFELSELKNILQKAKIFFQEQDQVFI